VGSSRVGTHWVNERHSGRQRITRRVAHPVSLAGEEVLGLARLVSMTRRNGAQTMKEQSETENLKTKLSSTYVRLAATAAAIPMAAFLGGIPLKNHNETLIRI
jgi:hypothetical protein